jgi:protoporphyrinogen/coproporphyrinogen III oxidase
MLDRIAEPLIAGIHAADPALMSLRASFPRLLDMERKHRSLILAARRAGQRPNPAGGLSHFASFAGGMSQLVEGVIGASPGVAIRTGVDAKTVEAAAGGYRVGLDDGSVVAAEGVVLATPARPASELLADLVPAASGALSGIRQVASMSVTLAFEARSLPPLVGSGFVVPSAQRRMISGVSYLSQKWDDRTPGPEFVLLRAFIDRNHGRELAGADDASLIRVVRQEINLMIGVDAKPVRTWVRALEEALHQYTMGHLDRVAAAERAMGAKRGLALAGAAFHGIGLNECVDSGNRAAESVLHALASRPPVRTGEAR